MRKQTAIAVKEEDGGGASDQAPLGGLWRVRTAQEVADEQGVKPIDDFDALLGGLWPEDESIDEFLEEVYRLRDEEAEQAAKEFPDELLEEGCRSPEKQAEREDKAA